MCRFNRSNTENKGVHLFRAEENLSEHFLINASAIGRDNSTCSKNLAHVFRSVLVNKFQDLLKTTLKMD